MYIVFPVVSYVQLATRLVVEPVWASVPDLRTLLLSIRLLNAAARYRMKTQDKMLLSDLIHQVESSRLCYDFGDPATLDGVVASLCLFTAYNVLEKHNRAFLYLDEAITLFEMVPVSEQEEQRRLRIEWVLFNTEAAALAIYASQNRRRRSRKPSLHITVQQGFGADAESDRVATQLLRRLTQIHLAEDADGLEDINIESEDDMETLFGAVLREHRYSRIQAADVIMTRQWQLSSKLVASHRDRSSTSRLPAAVVEPLGIAAMSSICLLKEGELRIVGLGKLAWLAQNIYALAGQTKCQDIIRGLTGALVREDHERTFAIQLNDLILPIVCSVPPLLGPQGGNQVWQYRPSPCRTASLAPIAIESMPSDLAALDVDLNGETPIQDSLLGVYPASGSEVEELNWFG